MPEGPSPPSTPPLSRWPSLWLVAVTLGLVLVGFAGSIARPRAAGYLLALMLAGTAVARLVLPEHLLREFAIRSRIIDAALCFGAAGLIALVCVVLPPV